MDPMGYRTSLSQFIRLASGSSGSIMKNSWFFWGKPIVLRDVLGPNGERLPWNTDTQIWGCRRTRNLTKDREVGGGPGTMFSQWTLRCWMFSLRTLGTSGIIMDFLRILGSMEKSNWTWFEECWENHWTTWSKWRYTYNIHIINIHIYIIYIIIYHIGFNGIIWGYLGFLGCFNMLSMSAMSRMLGQPLPQPVSQWERRGSDGLMTWIVWANERWVQFDYPPVN
jgi:hypothetical protein